MSLYDLPPQFSSADLEAVNTIEEVRSAESMGIEVKSKEQFMNQINGLREEVEVAQLTPGQI